MLLGQGGPHFEAFGGPGSFSPQGGQRPPLGGGQPGFPPRPPGGDPDVPPGFDAGGQGNFPPGQRFPGRPGQPGLPPAAPGQGPGGGFRTGPAIGYAPAPQMRISLGDLIDLLEQKLAAMKK